MTAVYSDQIWQGSECRKHERDTLLLLRRHNLDVVLVDALDSRRSYKKLVTDNITSLPHDPLYPEFWGTFAYIPVYETRAPTKLFNCFINRVCTTRQSWFYQFVRRDLLCHASVSFLLDSREPPRGKDLYEKNFIGYEIFAHEHASMRESVPYKNFHCSLEQAVIDTKISLVIETYFDWPNTIAFSEKIFRALQLPRPFMLFCSPGAVTALRHYGFDVWDDVCDHTYDSEPDPIQRQIMILDHLVRYRDCGMPDLDLDQCEARGRANRNRLRELRQKWPGRLKKLLDEVTA